MNSIDFLWIFMLFVFICDGSDGFIIIVFLNGLVFFFYVWRDESGNIDSGMGFVDMICLFNLLQNIYWVMIIDSFFEGCEVKF